MRSSFRLLTPVILVCLLAVSAMAHASVIFNGIYTAPAGDIQLVTLQGGSIASPDTLTGSLTFNNGTFVSGNFTFTDNANAGAVYHFTNFTAPYNCCNPVLEVVSANTQTPGAGGQLILDLQLSLNSSGDIVLCGTGAACQNQSYSQVYSPNGQAFISSGTLNPVSAATPSPAL